NLQALTGFTHLERSRSAPHPTRLPLADLSTSLAVVAAVQTALQGERDRVVLDIAMADALFGWTWLWEGIDPGALAQKAADRWPGPARAAVKGPLARLRRRLQREKLYSMPQYGLYRAADGWLAVGIVDEQHFWTTFAEAIGMPRAAGLGMPARTLLGPVLRPRIARRLARRTVAEWLAVFEPAGLPISAVLTLPEAMREPQLQRVVDGDVVLPPLPGARRPERPAPRLGEHDDEVFSALTSPA
ncbi:MAG: CoA transferase, partial [Myxococcales bacterium]|nr:CoA transferase [Myxococcales bacterium]